MAERKEELDPLRPQREGGTLNHRLQLRRLNQKGSDQLAIWAPCFLGLPYKDKTPFPSPTCLSFTSQPAGKLPACSLLQQHPPINQTL